MLKRSVVRLLLFGVPFCLAYVVGRPAPPVVTPAQTFVLCAYDDQWGEIVIAAEETGCAQSQARPSGWIVPAVAQPPHIASRPLPNDAAADNLLIR